MLNIRIIILLSLVLQFMGFIPAKFCMCQSTQITSELDAFEEDRHDLLPRFFCLRQGVWFNFELIQYREGSENDYIYENPAGLYIDLTEHLELKEKLEKAENEVSLYTYVDMNNIRIHEDGLIYRYDYIDLDFCKTESEKNLDKIFQEIEVFLNHIREERNVCSKSYYAFVGEDECTDISQSFFIWTMKKNGLTSIPYLSKHMCDNTILFYTFAMNRNKPGVYLVSFGNICTRAICEVIEGHISPYARTRTSFVPTTKNEFDIWWKQNKAKELKFLQVECIKHYLKQFKEIQIAINENRANSQFLPDYYLDNREEHPSVDDIVRYLENLLLQFNN